MNIQAGQDLQQGRQHLPQREIRYCLKQEEEAQTRGEDQRGGGGGED